jgi:hypothetical protein
MQKSSGRYIGAFLFTTPPQYANASHQDYECKNKSQRGQYLKYTLLNLVI